MVLDLSRLAMSASVEPIGAGHSSDNSKQQSLRITTMCRLLLVGGDARPLPLVLSRRYLELLSGQPARQPSRNRTTINGEQSSLRNPNQQSLYIAVDHRREPLMIA